MNCSVVVAALGTAQTLAWASSYYLPAILADPIAEGTSVSRTTVFGIFSASLLVSAVFGPIGYGLCTGLLGAPAPATQTLGPVLFGLLLDRMGAAAIAISAALCLAAFVALLLLKARTEPAAFMA